MRILYLVHSFNYGGAENHVLDLANSMTVMGNEVYILTRKGRLAERLIDEVTISDLKMSDLLFPLVLLRICRFIKRNRIEIIHAHKRLPILLASLAGKIMKIPVVATVHGQPRIDLRSPFSRRFPDRVIFVSRRLLNGKGSYREVGERALFIQNGVEATDPAENRDPASLCYISRIDRKHSSVIGMVIKEVMPEIIKFFPGISFHILGDGEFLDELRQYGAKFNAEAGREACVIHGYVKDVKPVAARAGLVLGVGRVALESLVAGVPVLSVNSEFLGDFITRENYSFFKANNFVAAGNDPPDASRLRDLILLYLSNPGGFREEALALRENILSDFGIMKISGQILEVYRQLSAITR
ncbi:MAG: glycosyltransferase [Bacteroidales bacterium]|jgi:glycosyltransferase involved in cell wall biosynthesis|nr:glycosyltransferase [Bacteroidales bacterium]